MGPVGWHRCETNRVKWLMGSKLCLTALPLTWISTNTTGMPQLKIRFRFYYMSRTSTAGRLLHRRYTFYSSAVLNAQNFPNSCSHNFKQSRQNSFQKITTSRILSVIWYKGIDDNVTDHTSPNADAEADLVPTFADSIKIIINCPPTYYSLLCWTYSHTCPQIVILKELIRRTWL
jgi:hypothetical protein